MSCDCLERIRKELAKDHKDVELDLTLSGQTFTTGTHVKVIRGKEKRVGVHIFHDYCPWCGKPYDEPEPVGNQGYAKRSPGLQVLEGDKHE